MPDTTPKRAEQILIDYVLRETGKALRAALNEYTWQRQQDGGEGQQEGKFLRAQAQDEKKRRGGSRN